MRIGIIGTLAAAFILGLPTAAAAATSKAERAARRDAIHRLHTTPLPPRTHTVQQLPATLGLHGPPLEPVTPNLVDVHSLFVTALGRNKAFAWFKSHPPPKAGALLTIIKGIDHPSRVLGFHWGNTRLVEERSLYVSIIARPSGGAAIRIDSQATWGDKGETA